MTRTGEGAIQRAILQYLAARHVLAFRMNTGAVHSEYKGKSRFMRFGVPGMADILAFPKIQQSDITGYGRGAGLIYEVPAIMWIEVKAENGKQSELQKSFQKQVEEQGHRYILARSIEDVEAAL